MPTPHAGGALVQSVHLAADYFNRILYLSYSWQCSVAKLDLDTFVWLGWAVTPSSGSGQGSGPLCGYGGDGDLAVGGPQAALSARIGQLAVASNGDLFITDTGNHRIRKVEYTTGILSTVAGNGVADQYTGE